MPDLRKIFDIIKRFAYYSLPVLLLYFIFRRIDITQLMVNLQKANPHYILLGVAIRPIQIILGAYRWRLMSNYYNDANLSTAYMIRKYWTGLAIGFFTPGNIGWHAYRIIVIGNKLKTYTAALITVVAEKLMGLLSVFVMIVIMYPIVSNKIVVDPDLYKRFYLIALFVLLVVMTIISLLIKFNYRQTSLLIMSYFNKIIIRAC